MLTTVTSLLHSTRRDEPVTAGEMTETLHGIACVCYWQLKHARAKCWLDVSRPIRLPISWGWDLRHGGVSLGIPVQCHRQRAETRNNHGFLKIIEIRGNNHMQQCSIFDSTWERNHHLLVDPNVNRDSRQTFAERRKDSVTYRKCRPMIHRTFQRAEEVPVSRRRWLSVTDWQSRETPCIVQHTSWVNSSQTGRQSYAWICSRSYAA